MSATTESNYQLLVKQAEALVDGESDWIANTANISALLFNSLDNVNFAGVYRYENNELILVHFRENQHAFILLLVKEFAEQLQKKGKLKL